VAHKVGAKLAVGQVPNLYKAVPAATNDKRVGSAWGEAYAGNPFFVSIFVWDGKFTFAKGVPKLDALVAGTTDDLTVILGKCHGKDVLGVADETAGGLAVGQVPEAKGTVPTSGKGELSVAGDDYVFYKVGVTLKAAAGGAVRFFSAGQVPYNDGLVARRGQDHVWVFGGGCDRSDPSVVAFELTAVGKLFRHISFDVLFWLLV